MFTAGVADGVGGLLPETMSGAAAGAITGTAAGGAYGYGLSCSLAANCSWGGLAASTSLGAGLDLGATFGALSDEGGS